MTFVILVNYNGADDTAACIQSLRSVRSPAFRVAVVDNGSTDGSVQKLRALLKTCPFELIEAGENRGFAAGCNLGIQWALRQGADRLLLLNTDTLVTEGFLTGLLSAFDRNPRCGASTCRIHLAAEPGRIWYAGGSVSRLTCWVRHFRYGQEAGSEPEAARPVSFASGCCLCLSADAFRKTGPLDEDYFLYEEDTDYCLRLRDRGFEIVYVPDAIIYHKVSASVRKLSSAAAVYPIRSKYMLIQKRLPPLRRPFARLYCTARLIVRCLKGAFTFQDLRRGISAFAAGEKGKTSF